MINKMKRADFEKIPYLQDNITDFDSIVLLPTKHKHNSGWNYYAIIVCLQEKPIARINYYDTFLISDFEGGIIDCLRTSCLMRIAFERGSYEIDPHLHRLQPRINGGDL